MLNLFSYLLIISNKLNNMYVKKKKSITYVTIFFKILSRKMRYLLIFHKKIPATMSCQKVLVRLISTFLCHFVPWHKWPSGMLVFHIDPILKMKGGAVKVKRFAKSWRNLLVNLPYFDVLTKRATKRTEGQRKWVKRETA